MIGSRRAGRINGRWMACIAVALGMLVLGSAGTAHAARPNEWWFKSRPCCRQLVNGHTVSLVNLTHPKVAALRYGETDYGVNLQYKKTSGGVDARIFSEGREKDVIRYGQKVAIQILGGPDGYLRYREQRFGVNLGLFKSRAYVWELRGGTIGTPVDTGDQQLALLNTEHEEYLVYGVRKGVNLAWYGSSPEPTTAGVIHTSRHGPFREPAVPQSCTGTVTWTFTPLRLGGGGGRTTAYTVTQSLTGRPVSRDGREYWCETYGHTPALRPGHWRIETNLGHSCERDLARGNNSVVVYFNRPGCAN